MWGAKLYILHHPLTKISGEASVPNNCAIALDNINIIYTYFTYMYLNGCILCIRTSCITQIKLRVINNN